MRILRNFRRTAAVGVVWAVALVGLQFGAPSASGQSAVEPGLGNAYAQGVKLDPRTGRLSLGITYGLSLAGHQNAVSQAESRSVDLGIIGTLLAAEGCDGGDPTLASEDQPQPLTATSTEEAAGVQKTDYEYFTDKRVVASKQPYARAATITSGRVEDGIIDIGSVRAVSESGIIDGARVAHAVSEVGYVSLLGGLVVMRGMVWEATYQTAPDEIVEGTFTMEGIEIAGRDDLTFGDDPITSIAEANAVLQPLGVEIVPPAIRHDAGIQFVDPMRIAIVPSSARDSLIGTVLNAAAPVREELVAAILEADCGMGTYITVLDVALGAVSGAGSLGIELGGVSATTDSIETFTFEFPSAAPSVETDTGSSFTPATAPVASSGGFPTPSPTTSPTTAAAAATPTVTPTPAPVQEVALGPVEPASGTRGGWLAAVGGLGLLGLAVFATADARRARRAGII